MRRRFGQRGEGNLGCILWTAFFLVVAMVAWKAVPVKIKSAQLYDFMVEQAKFAVKSPPDSIKGRILREAQRLDLPLDSKNLTVSKAGERLRIRAEYTVPLDFPGYTYEWVFDQEVDRAIYIF
jgi:hypothetical protein